MPQIGRSILLALSFALAVQMQEATGEISGEIRDTVSKAVLPGVSVSLAVEGRTRSITTDSSGRFRFADVPKGEYVIDIQRDGYTGGQQIARIREKTPGEPVTIWLTPLFEIEGFVLDEERHPLAGVQVAARKELTASVTGNSDAEGYYRLRGILPGAYQIEWRVPYPVRERTASRNTNTGEVRGYAPLQYYPGVDEAVASARVSVTGATHKLDLYLRRCLLVGLSGRIVDMATGAALAGTSIDLMLEGNRGLSDEILTANLDESGRFRFDLMTPGRYVMRVYRGGKAKPPHLLTVDVGRGGLTDSEFRLPPYQNVPVVVRVPDPRFGWDGTFEVQVRSWPDMINYQLGSFDASAPVIPGIPPGEWRFELRDKNVRQLSNPQVKLHIAAMQLGNQNAYGAPVTIPEGGTPTLEIGLTDQLGKITGAVEHERQASEEEAGMVYRKPIVLLEASTGPVLDFSQVDDDGTFTFADLPPGEYWVAAVGVRAMPRVTPRDCGERAAKVKVEGARTSSVRLRLCATDFDTRLPARGTPALRQPDAR